MQRLTGMDATFLYMETPSAYMHVAGLMVLDPSTVEGGFDMDSMREFYDSRLHLAAPFRRRLAEIPMGLHHPLWIEDPDFDLDYHLRHIAVPPPGGDRQLADLAAHLVTIHLDRSRPLWESWAIEGLDNGHMAVLTKVHHAAIDGVSGNEITVAMLQLAPDDEAPPPDEEWVPDRIPTEIERLGYAANSLARQPFLLAKTVRRTAQTALRTRQRNQNQDVEPPPGFFAAPRTSFNVSITPHRSFAFTSVSLTDVKTVKNAFGVSVNDVVLAVCAGSLRHYLESRQEHPDAPLVAMVPVSVRTEEQQGTLGNQVSQMLCTLATDVDDPVKRLHVIHDGTQQAKSQLNAIGADSLTDWAEFAAPALAGRAARFYSRSHLADRHRPLFNVTISNVPGPPFPLYSNGARVVAHYPMGPIFDGAGLNITVMSYLDQLDFGLVACKDLISDVWSLADGLTAALEELKKAATA
ncbi:MAG TPA: wax ester/triacylglycerol synthase family O-acyltransferase [Acidimicrobiales bacterium]|jgi:WS/DGAT/MGAT family acyltransferase|nr:wax ester/triacylglycerol synthase family O-acyltransferase [Acidimicrobiales bacterium]